MRLHKYKWQEKSAVLWQQYFSICCLYWGLMYANISLSHLFRNISKLTFLAIWNFKHLITFAAMQTAMVVATNCLFAVHLCYFSFAALSATLTFYLLLLPLPPLPLMRLYVFTPVQLFQLSRQSKIICRSEGGRKFFEQFTIFFRNFRQCELPAYAPRVLYLKKYLPKNIQMKETIKN